MRYATVVVFGSRIVQRDGRFVPSTYADHGVHGLSGGHMRGIAAACLYVAGLADTFVFTGGAQSKPVGAVVHADAFRRHLTAMGVDTEPRIVLETRSFNTLGNLTNSLPLLHPIGRIGLLSSWYHLERIAVMCRLLAGPEVTDRVDYLSAEDLVLELVPGVHDAEIAAARVSPAARTRIESEQRGVQDLRAGRYKNAEQLRNTDGYGDMSQDHVSSMNVGSGFVPGVTGLPRCRFDDPYSRGHAHT